MAEGNDYWPAKVETMRRIEAKLRAEIETLDRSLRESWANEKRLADERDGLRSLMRGIQQLRNSDPNAAAIADAALAGVETTCDHDYVWREAFRYECDKCGKISRDGIAEERAATQVSNLFDQYPVGTLFQKKEDGRIVAMTPDGKTQHAGDAVETSGEQP